MREVLADLRPNVKVIAELRELFGDATPAVRDAGVVDREWREAHLLCPARAIGDGALCEVDGDLVLRRELEREHAVLLAEHGMDHLDVAQVRSRDRIVTQTIGRSIFRRGYLGVGFGSNVDDGRCVAIFEGRAELRADGVPLELTHQLPQLVQVCAELGLALDGG